MTHALSLTPFRKVVKDYFLICDSYHEAIRAGSPSRIEAIDMGRRGLHNEGVRGAPQAARRQGRARLRHGAPAVHADLRAPLADVRKFTGLAAAFASRSDRIAAGRRRMLQHGHRPPAPRARLRLAAAAAAARTDRHRAGQAAAGRHRRDRRCARSCRARWRAGWRTPRRRRRGASPTAIRSSANAFILAADTVVAVGRRILPNPEFTDEAAACLRLLSGRGHRVYGALCLITPKGKVRNRIVETRLRFKRLSREEIETYLASGEWEGKAGGYAIQGRAGGFVTKLVGSYTNVVGLALYETMTLPRGRGLSGL